MSTIRTSARRAAGAGLGLWLVACLAPTVASAASLQVTVQEVRDARGHVRIGVCTQPEFLSEHCALHRVVPAHAGQVIATFDRVPPGLYAIAVYQDRNDSGRLQRGFLGMPQEDLGFSRNPSLRFGPPSFKAAALRFGTYDAAAAVVLHHFGS